MDLDPQSLRYDTISFLSDYGHDDEFVGVCRSVMRALAPEAAVVDITHAIRPFDVRAGSLALARSVQYLCAGVVVAVVDPGVGTDRRAVAIEVGDGASVLVGPDNGLLAPAVAMVGGATRAVEITNPEYRLESEGGPTFDGRDVFAPAAAFLSMGVPLTELGPEVDPATLLPGMLPVVREENGALAAEVLWVDRYGNVQLNVDADDLAALGDRLAVRIRGARRGVDRVETFARIDTGRIGLLADSYGLMALAVDRGSASEELDIAAGDEVVIEPAGDEEPVGIPVSLGRREEGC